jgi:acyl-CoA synthetase (AMP-forming)/AMP-acid ligase II/acyl carrier protein
MANQRLSATACNVNVYTEPHDLVELLQFWAKRCGTRRAFTFQRDDGHETSVDYATLDRRARAIAADLQQRCQRGDRALLLFPAGLDFIAAFFGCAYAGVLAVPVCYPKPKRPMPRLLSIAEDAEPRVALTNHKTLEQFDFALIGGREFEWIASDHIPDELANEWSRPCIEGRDLAFLQYTSGSTSDPKGVMVSHANVLHNLEVIRQGFGIEFDLQSGEPRNRGVFWLPAYHDMGLIGGILTPLYVGGHSLLMSPGAFLQRPLRWLQSISDTRATISGAPNFAYELCVSKIPVEKRAELDLSCWDVGFCGAEPVRAETLGAFAAAFRECGFRRQAFYPCYGLAENTLMAAGGEGPSIPQVKTVLRDALAENQVVEPNGDPGKAVQELVCCGAAVLDQRIVIVDPHTRLARGMGEVGEIWIQGRSVAQGYWNRPAETAATFNARLEGEDGGTFLRTGDLGFLDHDRLYITGRVKDLIILRGRNHYPQDIERTVESCHPALRANAGVAVAIDIHGEESLVVIHEIDRAYRDLDLTEITRSIRRAIADEHEVSPYAIVLIRHASLPVTTSGKVQRSLARRLYLAGDLKVLEEWVAPQYTTISMSRNGAGNLNGAGHEKSTTNGALAPFKNAGSNGKARVLPMVANGTSSPGAPQANEHDMGRGKIIHASSHHSRANGTSRAEGGAGRPSNGGAQNGSVHPADGRSKNMNHGASASSLPRKTLKISRIQFDHFPLAADEIDRLSERIEKWILDWLVEHAAVNPSEIERHKPFAEYGLDSLTAVEMSHSLEEWLGVELTPVIAWNYPTPHKISQYLARTVGGAEANPEEPATTTEDDADDFERLLAEIENLSESEAEDALSPDQSSPKRSSA